MDNQILDELMALAEFDPEEIKYIREHISPELNEKIEANPGNATLSFVFQDNEDHTTLNMKSSKNVSVSRSLTDFIQNQENMTFKVY